MSLNDNWIMSLRHAWSMVDPEEANTFLIRGKHKEWYMIGGTFEEIAYKMGY